MKKNAWLLILGLVIGLGLVTVMLSKYDHDHTAMDPELPSPVTTNDYVGLTEAQATAQAEIDGELFRVVERDGEALMVTEDYRPGRINAVVDAGVVVSYEIEGDALEVLVEPGSSNGASESDTMDEDRTSDDVSTDVPNTAEEHDGIIGLTEAAAFTYAAENDLMFRIGYRDGEPLPLTMDYRPGRITATIIDDEVVSYTVE